MTINTPDTSTLKTVAVALVMALIGILLIVVGSHDDTGWRASLTYNTGSFIIASVVLALIWQFWQSKSFFEDMLRKSNITENLCRARITHFFTSFYDAVPWDELFAGSRSLDIFFAYGATWRNTHKQSLERFLDSDHAKLNVVLPDPENEVVMAEMSQRFGYQTPDLQQKVKEAKCFFEKLAENGERKVKIYYIKRSLTFTFYRFSSGAVFTTYRHKQGRGPIVTLVCEREGELYGWIRDEWYGIIEGQFTRQVYPGDKGG